MMGMGWWVCASATAAALSLTDAARADRGGAMVWVVTGYYCYLYRRYYYYWLTYTATLS